MTQTQLIDKDGLNCSDIGGVPPHGLVECMKAATDLGLPFNIRDTRPKSQFFNGTHPWNFDSQGWINDPNKDDPKTMVKYKCMGNTYPRCGFINNNKVTWNPLCNDPVKKFNNLKTICINTTIDQSDAIDEKKGLLSSSSLFIIGIIGGVIILVIVIALILSN